MIDNMPNAARYLSHCLAGAGLSHVFSVTGGGAMFLNDAFGHESGITPVYCHHEQACAMAAEAWARISGRPGLVCVTSGPGAINALNGVFGAWTDSLPVIVISGQVKRETCLANYKLLELRQLGDQEADILALARPITKYAAYIDRPEDIRYHLEKALFLATHGRPGPAWLDIPIDVQSSKVEPERLEGFHPAQADVSMASPAGIDAHTRDILGRLTRARRPVILAGTGIRAGNALAAFERVIHILGIPVTTAWTHDIIASDHPLFCGRPGTIGTRAGNFTVQNADLLLVLGSRLNIRQVSYNWSGFAPRAFKIQVDIDEAELNKPTVRPDLAVRADLRPLLTCLADMAEHSGWDASRRAGWLAWCRERGRLYPNVTARQRAAKSPDGRINPYPFIEALFERLDADDIVACGNATACIVPFQVARLKAGQRIFSNSGSASMGYDLPAAIGAWFGALASRGAQRRVICLAGDGSLQLNVQELQTVVNYRIPVKLFVLDNLGYLSIRSSQNNFFKRLSGADPDSGLTLPDYVNLAQAYGIPACRASGEDYPATIDRVLASEGPMLCQVLLDPSQGFEPRMSSRQLPDGRIVTPPLEDMYPFLDRDELARNMLD